MGPLQQESLALVILVEPTEILEKNVGNNLVEKNTLPQIRLMSQAWAYEHFLFPTNFGVTTSKVPDII